MTTVAIPTLPTKSAPSPQRMTLPSDQDASGRTLGAEEIELLRQVIESGTLTATKGAMTKELERRFAQWLGVSHAHACSSGTAALHTAFAAIDPEPGDEIVTTAITDMGALTPILYQGAIPVFADVDPRTYNLTAAAIERVLSDRTRAIVVTHLFGNPCDMTEIMALARDRGLKVIEDCAQAFGARHRGQLVGTFGDIGCFSLQQGKHITTGEGGLVTSGDAALARRMFLFINKAWGYGDPQPDHYFIALNYRISELQAAVAVAQLEKLDEVVRARVALAEAFTQRIIGLPGVTPPTVRPGNEHTYWKYCLDVDGDVLRDETSRGAVALGKLLRDRGIASAPRYIQKPAFRCEVFAQQRTFGSSRYPFTLARPEAVDYRAERFAGTFAALDRVLVLPWTERYTHEHLDFIATALHDAVGALRKG